MNTAITNSTGDVVGTATRTKGRNAGQTYPILANWALKSGRKTASGRVYQYRKEDGTIAIVGVAHAADWLPGIPRLSADKSALEVSDGTVPVGSRFTYDGALAAPKREVEKPGPVTTRKAKATAADDGDGLTLADILAMDASDEVKLAAIKALNS